MAITAEELRILVRAETKSAVTNLNRFRKSSKNTTVDLKQLAKSLIGPLSVTAGIIMLGRVASNAVRSSIRYAASVQQIGVAFEVLLGSAEAAQDVLEELRQFSVKTPFTFEELAPTAQQLISVGVAAGDVVDILRDLGNVAGGDAEKLKRLADAFSKLKNKGRASLEEINRFSEAGVPLIQQLAENLEMTNEELFKFISAGKVGFDEVNQALQDLARGEGAFAGMLEAQSLTLTGAISTLKGAFQELGNALAKDFLPFLTAAVQKITGFVNLLNDAKTVGELTAEVFGEDFFDFGKLRGAELGEAAIKKLETVAKLEGLLAKERERLLVRSRTMIPGTSSFRQAQLQFNAIEDSMAAISLITEDLTEIARRAGIALSTVGEDAADVVKTVGSDAGEDIVEAFVVAMTDFLSPDTLQEFNNRFFNPIVDGSAIAGAKASKEFSRNFKEGLEGGVQGGEIFTFDPLIRGADKSKTAVDNLKDSLVKLGDVLGSPSTGESMFDPIVNAPDEAAAAMNRLWDSIGGSAAEALGQAGLQLLTDLGKAAGDASEGAKTAEQAFQDFVVSIMNSLPQLLFSASIRAFASGMWELGLGLLAASGLAALVGGAVEGRRDASRADTDLPDPATIARAGNTFAGDTITIVQGDVMVRDARDAEAIGAMSAANGNR